MSAYIPRLADKMLADKLSRSGAVLTGGRYAYTRSDGVLVVPIGCLAH